MSRGWHNGPYVKRLFEYVPWTALSGTVDGNGESYMAAGGMVTLSASLHVTSNGMSVPAMPDRYKPKKPLYLPSYYYSSNNLMGAWVPNKGNSYSKIYLYALGSSVGSLLDCSWSWPLNVYPFRNP